MGLGLYLTFGALTLAAYRLANDWVVYRRVGPDEFAKLEQEPWTPHELVLAAFIVWFWPISLSLLLVAVISIMRGWVDPKDLD